jgi:hypothetical protein
MLLRRAALVLFAVLPGASAAAVSGRFLLQDWAALRTAFTRFESLAAGGADQRALFIAHAYQETYRLNCFAEGVGVLLGAILLAIGVHGLVVMGQSTAGAGR